MRRTGPRVRRGLAGALVAALTFCAATTSVAAAGKTAKVKNNEPCTMLTTRQLETFGKPVVPDNSLFLYDCNYSVGADPKQPPGGVFTAVIEHPIFGQGYANAREATEDKRAVADLSDHVVEDVPKVGDRAYFDRTEGSLTVAANKKFAFTLTWRPGGVDTVLDKASGKKLVKLARDVVKRSPR